MDIVIQPMKAGVNDYPRLLAIWESSVRATHDFLVEDDIAHLRSLIIEHSMFSNTNLICALTTDNIITGYAGVTGDSLDMLFIDAAYRKCGIGKMLTLEAIEKHGVKKVDVNEQNSQAIGFYEQFGFVTVGRSDVDELGNQFPILHMELK